MNSPRTANESVRARAVNVFLMLLAVVIMTAAPADAQMKGVKGAAGMGKPNMVKWWEEPEVQDGLQLSDAQVHAIAELIESHQQRLKDIVLRQRTAYRLLIQNIDRAAVDPELRQRRESEFLAAWGEQAQANIEKWTALREILSFEQWAQLPETAPTALRIGHLAVVSRGTIRVDEGNGD